MADFLTVMELAKHYPEAIVLNTRYKLAVFQALAVPIDYIKTVY